MNVADLEQAIRRASYLYYNEPEKVILSDEQFDYLVKELRERVPDSPVLNEIGATPIEGKVRHYQKMYSLDNAMNESEANKWFAQFGTFDLVVSQKMDGASLEIVYINGIINSITSRGDGLFGDKVSHAKCLVPEKLPEGAPVIVVVHGEVVISGTSFEAIGNGYSSPRNLAAGSIMTKDNPDVLIERGAQFMAYDITGFQDYGRRLQILEDYGFTTVPYTVTKGMNGAKAAYETLLGLRDKFYNEYGPSDGVVVRIDRKDISDHYGYSEKAPKFAFAWKFPSEEKLVKINRIRWDVSKNGRLTPVAEFDGVVIDGATITNCTLSNASLVRDNRYGVDAIIKIIRSGGVIPKVIGVEKLGQLTKLGEVECPSCGTLGIWDENNTFLHCPNDSCPAQAADFITEFLDRLEYKGLGDKSSEKLVEFGVTDPAKLFKMEVWDIASVLGFSELHAQQVYEDLQRLKQVPYERFLHALNIDMLGRRYSKQFAEYVTPEDFKALVGYWKRESTYIPVGYRSVFHKIFGGITAERMLDSFLNKIDFIQDLYNVGFEVQERKRNNGGAMKFVITGTLSKPRKEYEKLIEEAGHEYQSSLTKDTNFLVIGENTGANKTAKAKKFGTKIITEQGLINLLEGRE